MKLQLGQVLLSMCLGGCASTPTCPDVRTPTGEAATEPRTAADRPTTTEPEPAPATVVLLVRHAEKETDGTPDPPLTERGRRRAECLATLLAPFEPDHLLTSEYQRTRSTIEPLARAAGLTPTVIEASDGEAWAAALHGLPPGSRAVVSGHSNTLPEWVAALGGRVHDLDEDGNIPHDDYDRMIQVILDGRGRAVTDFTTAYCIE